MNVYCRECGHRLEGFYLHYPHEETVDECITLHDGQPYESIEDAIYVARGTYQVLEAGTMRVVAVGTTDAVKP